MSYRLTSRTWRKWIGYIVNFFRLTRRHARRGRCNFGSATAARSSAWRWQAEQWVAAIEIQNVAEAAGITTMSASLIGRLGSSAFRLSTNSSVDVAHGLSLLFGLGTRALPSWDSKTRWNNLSGDLAVNVTAGSSGHTNSPHPSSREGHHSTVGWSSISSYCIWSRTGLSSRC